jgi:hypothetical protein
MGPRRRQRQGGEDEASTSRLGGRRQRASRRAPEARDGGCGVEPRAASGEVRPLNPPLIPADSGAQGPNPAMMHCPRRLGGSARRATNPGWHSLGF